MTKPVAILSLDGLSIQQFERILDLSPDLRETLRHQTRVKLDASPFTEAHPIWAELLTGARWYESGCASFAQPTESLNKLEVITEGDLTRDITLVGKGSDSIVSNVPIVTAQQRVWISDGSAPSMILAKPDQVRKRLGKGYKPRAQSMLALAFRDPIKAIESAAQSEITRLEALSPLIDSDDWRQAIVRLTYFDQIQHIYGLEPWLHPKHLSYETTLKVVEALNSFVKLLTKKCDKRIAVISAFSLVRCISRFNLNALLRETGLLRTEEYSAKPETAHRLKAAETIGNTTVSGASLGGFSGRFDEKATIAASPVSGSVYLNLQRRFKDGLISEEEKESEITNVQTLINERSSKYVGRGITVHCAPSSAENEIGPQFVVQLPGTEFFDTGTQVIDGITKPPVCHSSTGFISIDATAPVEKIVNLQQTHQMLRTLGFGV